MSSSNLSVLIDITGQRFGRWTAISRVQDKSHRSVKWLCRCECGNEKAVAGKVLRDGVSKSCGCLMRELAKVNPLTHGHAKPQSPIYRTWSAMLQRCTNPKAAKWLNYGGRGITVCERWRSFENFLEDMGPRPDGLSLDRIDNNGNYEPGNCRWADEFMQAANRRRPRRTRWTNRQLGAESSG